MLSRAGRQDQRLSRQLADRPPGRAAWLASQAARGNAMPVWAAVTAALVASGPRGRTAAARAVTAGATASVLGSRVMKPIVGRGRPRRPRVGERRASYALPSGHASTGTAYAATVLAEWPAAGVPCAVLAASLAASRVRDGHHYLGDVVVGAAWGLTAASAWRVVWRRRDGAGSPEPGSGTGMEPGAAGG